MFRCVSKFTPHRFKTKGYKTRNLEQYGGSDHESSFNNYSTSATDGEVLHRSKLATDHFQASLPRLPVPKLEDTCSRYLKAQLPLLSPDVYTNTQNIVNSFREGDGKALNEELIARDKKNKHTNYVSDAWFDMYLRDRRAICLNQNPFIVFNDDPKVEYNDQAVRTTNFLMSSVRFMNTLKANILEPEVFHLNPAKSDNDKFRRVMRLFPKSIAFYGAALIYKAYALDMSQYPRLFSSTRIPRPEKDELYTNRDSRHITVLRKGHFYTLDMLDDQGRMLPATQVLANVQHILSDNVSPAEYPLAVLSSQDRDTWSRLRQDICDSGNSDQLNKIDSGLFVLCLDDTELNEPDELSRSFLHGDGTNRWFDKSFSLLLSKNGKASVNFEHAWGDGVAVLRYFNEVFKDSTENPHIHPNTQPASIDSSTNVQRLEFQLSNTAKRGIKDAHANFKNEMSKLDMDFMKYEAHGKNDIKRFKLSPDSFMQLAFQMGYYRQYGNTVATYESCSTAAFKHGRTETIRPATALTKQACEMFDKSSGVLPSVSELQNCLKQCSAMHGQLTKEAAMGQGFDRHLFGLKNLAVEKGGELPELYRDPAYASINHNILSTSTLASPAVLIGGFAPVVPDGFGVGYGIDDAYLGCNVTAYKANRRVSEFVQAVEQSVTDLINVMEGNPLK